MKAPINLILGICIIAFGFSLARAAAPDSLWMRAYGDSNIQQCRDIIETLDGGYAFAGYTVLPGVGIPNHYDVYVVRLDSDGDTLWTNHYGGLGNDVGYALRQTSDGGFIVAGYSAYPDDPSNRDVYLVKLDSLGAQQWEKRYGGAGRDEAYDVQVLAGGSGFILTGYTATPGPFDSDVYLLLTNSSGDTLITRQFDYTINDAGYSVCQTTNGFLVCGHVQGSQSYDVLLLKTNSHLLSSWTKTYGGPGSDAGYCVKVTPDQGFIVAADRLVAEVGLTAAWALRTDSAGDTLWTLTVVDSAVTRFQAVDVTSDSGYVFAGMREIGLLPTRDFYVVKLASDGAMEWQTVYGTPYLEDAALSIEEIAGGDFIMGGYTGPSGSTHMDALVVKTGGLSGVRSDLVAAVSSPVLRSYPNPSKGSAAIAFDSAVKGDCRVTIYDIAGRLVVDLFAGELAPGRHCFQWDGRDAGGLSLPAGVYFCKVALGDRQVAGKVVLAR
jgi:hypothetical protein